MELWSRGPSAQTEGWGARDLPQLLDSANLHLELSELFAQWDLDRALIVVSYSQAPERVATPEAPELVVTVPAFESVRVRVKGIEDGRILVEVCAELEPWEPGQDLWVELGGC